MYRLQSEEPRKLSGDTNVVFITHHRPRKDSGTYGILKFLLSSERTCPNMFDAHSPFQIDGNFGGTSGIAEMLLQSQTGENELLPAVPEAWPKMAARPWRVRGRTGMACKVCYNKKLVELKLQTGRLVRLNADLQEVKQYQNRRTT